ncbi:septation protein SpoVG family protein [Candidatus Babeliales bacterium]|nr:septation protein SpoVG family protein [Candidatus Babeliales bacterium]MBP9843995.1 septation protein SpoVG family protein [Candidatus Babeliales bacterium]
MMIKISEIQIVPVISDNGLIAFASFVINDAFHLSSIGIFTCAKRRYRLTYPKRTNTRQSLNFFFPINKEVAQQVELAVIKKFEEIVNTN